MIYPLMSRDVRKRCILNASLLHHLCDEYQSFKVSDSGDEDTRVKFPGPGDNQMLMWQVKTTVPRWRNGLFTGDLTQSLSHSDSYSPADDVTGY